MTARIAKLLSFSNVVACLALFIALGGSVYAAGKISGEQIKRNSMPGNRIKPKTIPANRIKPKSLTGRQVKAKSLTGAQINQKTLTGVTAAALSGVTYQTATAWLPGNGKQTTATANCPPGTLAIGGGALVGAEAAMVTQDGPSTSHSGWTASGYAWLPGIAMTVTAVCVVLDTPGGATTPSITPTTPGPPQYNPAG